MLYKLKLLFFILDFLFSVTFFNIKYIIKYSIKFFMLKCILFTYNNFLNKLTTYNMSLLFREEVNYNIFYINK